MTPSARNWVIALGSTLAALCFALAILAMVPTFAQTLGARNGSGLAVTYTFERYDSLGTTTQYRSCRWLGTVSSYDESSTDPNSNVVLAKDVVFRDEPPDGVQPGDTTDALWTQADPRNAFDFYSSDAWLNTLGSGIVASVGVVLFIIIAVIWWRRIIVGRTKSGVSPVAPRSQPADSAQDPEHHPAS